MKDLEKKPKQSKVKVQEIVPEEPKQLTKSQLRRQSYYAKNIEKKSNRTQEQVTQIIKK